MYNLPYVDLCIPKYSPKFQNRKQPYTNHQVMMLKHHKEAPWRRYCATGDHLDYHRFAIARNSLRNQTCQLRSKHEYKIANFITQYPKVFGSTSNLMLRSSPVSQHWWRPVLKQQLMFKKWKYLIDFTIENVRLTFLTVVSQCCLQ